MLCNWRLAKPAALARRLRSQPAANIGKVFFSYYFADKKIISVPRQRQRVPTRATVNAEALDGLEAASIGIVEYRGIHSAVCDGVENSMVRIERNHRHVPHIRACGQDPKRGFGGLGVERHNKGQLRIG